ncbi:MAG: hypothetical protein ACP5XB_17960 [Isosphaeraceae bacterium]
MMLEIGKMQSAKSVRNEDGWQEFTNLADSSGELVESREIESEE